MRWGGGVLDSPTCKFEQHGGIAFRREQAYRDLRWSTAIVLKYEDKALHAPIATAQEGRKVAGEAPQRKQQRHAGFDVVLELDPGFEPVRWPVPVERRGLVTAEPVQMRDQRLRETPDDAFAG